MLVARISNNKELIQTIVFAVVARNLVDVVRCALHLPSGIVFALKVTPVIVVYSSQLFLVLDRIQLSRWPCCCLASK